LISTPEIAWVAGLLEGEGTFGMSWLIAALLNE